MTDVQYVEPYAGGASLALSLLLGEYASTIHINDLSRPVFAFWHSVLNETDALCRRIDNAQVTMDEWQRQRAVYGSRECVSLRELGFATFFLNRANRSGIISGGVIGGKRQTGAWSIDARFNKGELIQRIRRIARYKNRIHLYHMDGLDFTIQVVPQIAPNAFVFYDPPYIEKGKDLYLNDYDLADHRKLAARVVQLEQPWVATYDYEAATRHRLYQGCRRLSFELSYRAQGRHCAREVMFLADCLRLPPAWRPGVTLPMTPSHSRYPVHGVMETEGSGRTSSR